MVEIKPNDMFLFQYHNDPGDPFEPRRLGGTKPVRVLEVRDGWVRYRLGWLFPDERKPIQEFLSMYTKVDSE